MSTHFRQLLIQAAELLNRNRAQEAEPILLDLHRQHPMDGHVLYNLGLCQMFLNRRLEAIRLWRTALSADPNLVPAMVNLGQALFQAGELRESLRYLQMAVRRRPRDGHILASLAKVLTNLGEATDGLEAADAALRVEPANIRALGERMLALSELKRHPEALETALRILDLPDGRNHIDALCYALSQASKNSDWPMLDRFIGRLEEQARNPTTVANPMALTFFFDDPEMLGDIARRVSAGRIMPARPAHPQTEGPITIAYLSPDFREHPVAHMLLDVLANHDRQRFRVVAIDTLPMDASPLSQAIFARVDEHLDLTRLDDSAAANLLRAHKVDVLVDLVGSTKWSRPGLLARRPCPAQILWLGCPCTTGTPYYDAFLVDEVVAPPGYERYCTEPLLRLPCCYHPMSLGLGTPNPRLTRQVAKLPEDVTIVGLLQAPNKIRPPLVDAVARAIARHPEAHLWMRFNPNATEAITQHMVDLGLPRERLHFAPLYANRDEYLHMYHLVDLVVDSHPYGGHSMTGEALVQGTPVLTMSGRSIHARVATSMLHELGMDDFAVPDLASLEQRLDALLSDPADMAHMKQRFAATAADYRANGSQRLARALEQAYCRVLDEAPR